MSSIQSSGPSIASFRALANAGEAVVLKDGQLKSTEAIPAKQGIFGRAVTWLKTTLGFSSSKANEATRAAFSAAFGKTASGEQALRLGNFDVSSNKPLSSREIKVVVDHARSINTFDREIKALKKELQIQNSKFDAFVGQAMDKGLTFDQVDKGSTMLFAKIDQAQSNLDEKLKAFSEYLKR